MIKIEDWTKEKINGLKDNDAAEFIRAIVGSPYYDGYVTVKNIIDRWNIEIQGSDISLTSDKDDKSFDRAHKYLTEMKPYYEQLDYFRSKLLPQEIEEVNERAADLLDEARLKIKRNGKG